MLAARRRLLGMLLALAAGSATLAVTKMAAWWVILPPFAMLAGYLGLLREASKADAERRELARTRTAEAATRRAAPAGTASAPVTAPAAVAGTAPVTAPTAGAAATAAPAAPATPPAPAPPVPDAEVIDISASLGTGGEEFYDQYADAKLRAVGDLLVPRPRPEPLGDPGGRACLPLGQL